MALAARARGTSAQLAGKAESTVGTAPSGDWAKLPIISIDLTAKRPLVPDPVLSLGYGRNPPPGFYDKLEISGTAVVPLDTGNFDFWMPRLFGAVSTTGTYTDTYTAGTAPVSCALEKGFTDVADYWVYTGIFGDSLGINFSPLGNVQMSIGLIGLGSAAMSGSTSAGTVTTATYAPVRQIGSTFSVAGSALGNVISGNLMFKNGLDPVYTMDAATTGAPSAIDPGLMDFRGSLTLRYDGNTQDADARAGTVRTASLAFVAGAYAITFDFGQVRFETVSPPISGPGGIEQTVNFVGEYDGNPSYGFKVTRTRGS